MKTRRALEDTFQHLSASNKNKKNVEKAITKQLMMTKSILKKTRTYDEPVEWDYRDRQKDRTIVCHVDASDNKRNEETDSSINVCLVVSYNHTIFYLSISEL